MKLSLNLLRNINRLYQAGVHAATLLAVKKEDGGFTRFAKQAVTFGAAPLSTIWLGMGAVTTTMGIPYIAVALAIIAPTAVSFMAGMATAAAFPAALGAGAVFSAGMAEPALKRLKKAFLGIKEELLKDQYRINIPARQRPSKLSKEGLSPKFDAATAKPGTVKDSALKVAGPATPR